MKHRWTHALLTAAAVCAMVGTGALVLQRSAAVRRGGEVDDLIVRLEAERLAGPVTRPVLYGATESGSAWEHYLLALECVAGIDRYRDRCMAIDTDETGTAAATAHALLAEAGEAIDHLHRGTDARDATRSLEWSAHISARIVRLTHVRALSQLARARAYELIGDGDSVAAAHVMLDMQQFAADLMMSPVQIEEMIGCAYVAPERFHWRPVPGRPGMSDQGKAAWLDGLAALRSRLPAVGRSFEGEIELLARAVQAGALSHRAGNPGPRSAAGSPGWRYGYSWETAATEFLVDLMEDAPAYRAAFGRRDGLRFLERDDEIRRSSTNPAATRILHPLRSTALARREAFMRLHSVEHAVAVDLGRPSTKPEHPLGHPVDVEVTADSLRVRHRARGGHRPLFELHR